MLRSVFTLVLIVTAVGLAFTPRGLALFGSNLRVLVAVLVVLAVLQAHRLVSTMQAKKRGDRLNRIPKRPLGI
jgi:vancomycin permeability regulator SanA